LVINPVHFLSGLAARRSGPRCAMTGTASWQSSTAINSPDGVSTRGVIRIRARESVPFSKPLSGLTALTEQSVLPGFFATWANVTFKPNAFFSRPPAQRSRWAPVKFALLTYALWEPFNIVYLTFPGHRSLSLAALAALGGLAISPVTT